MAEIISRDEAHNILEPHLASLKIIMNESLEAVNKAISASGESLNNRARCALFHSIAIEKAKKKLSDCKDITIKSKYQSLQIIFDGQLVGRIKKVNKEDLSSNAKTHRNQLIISQQPNLFPDLPTITFVDIAYKTDSTWAEFEKLVIVCRKYDDIKWRIPYKDTPIIVKPIQQPKEDIITVNEEIQIKIKKDKKAG